MSLQPSPNRLPTPEPDEQAHSKQLAERIRAEIDQAGGAIGFDRYMELALYAPGLGYYVTGHRKFGEQGDFITSPEVSPLFAQCLATQCQQVLEQIKDGDLLEFGAGSGVLAADILLELERLKSLPDTYMILDVSPELRQRQRETLQRKAPHLLQRITWIDTLPNKFSGVMLANEVLDAMPVHQFRLSNDSIEEQFVRYNEQGDFEAHFGTPTTPNFTAQVQAQLPQDVTLAEGYYSEINLRATPWIKAISDTLQTGAVLLIDYGYPGREYYHPDRNQGTLMCHYRHRAHADPLILPGLQDITAFVDFTAVADAALEAGLAVDGFTTQAHFLMGAGLDRLVARSDPNDTAAHLQLMQGVKRLTLPSEMGERFKVLGLSRGLDLPLSGFSFMDMRGRL